MDQLYIHHVLRSVDLFEVQEAFSVFSDQYHSKLIKFTQQIVSSYLRSIEIVSLSLMKLLKNKKLFHDIESIDEQDINHFIMDINRWNGIKISAHGNPPRNCNVISSFEIKY